MTTVGVVRMQKTYFIYILSNESRMLYIGVTNDVTRRALEHKSKSVPGFTLRYNLHKLVYFEEFGNINAAIAREKQLKGWLRSKKVALVNSKNPLWKDLAEAQSQSGARFKKLASMATRSQRIPPTPATKQNPSS
jgi:putative endonuclease